jgi:hypothetical protein
MVWSPGRINRAQTGAKLGDHRVAPEGAAPLDAEPSPAGVLLRRAPSGAVRRQDPQIAEA